MNKKEIKIIVEGKKLCPIIFHDVVKPKWQIDDLI